MRQNNRYIEPLQPGDELKNLWKGLLDQSTHGLSDGLGEALSDQFFGSADLQPGQEVSLARKQQQTPSKEQSAERKPAVAMEHIEYFRTVQNVDRAPETRTETQISQAVEQIRLEIKKLVQTSKIVERTVKDATAEKAPVKPGKYHINFFEFVLNMLKDATRKLEDASSLGQVFTSKKQQSKYWNTYKKQGTSFGLSGERTTATQTG